MNVNDINPGTPVTLTLTDGNTLAGIFISVNSKGVNIKTLDGKTVSRAVSRVDRVDVYGDTTTADTPADLFADADTYTAGVLAAILDMAAKDLRVELRAMGLHVGKGHRYAFTADEARAIATKLAAN
jgi:hypothetical protein